MSERPLTHLPESLGSILDDAVDEERVHELWRGTRARMARADRWRAAARGGAVVAAVAVCVIGVIALGGQGGEPSAAGASALRLATGELPVAISVSEGGRGLRVALDEGSSIALAPGAAWRPVENVPARFETELARGSAMFDVTPGRERRWVVRAGATTVEVLGTRFEVSREGDGARVSVERGVVRVIDARLEGGETILRAGESVAAGTPAEAAVAGGDLAAAAATAPAHDEAVTGAGPVAGGEPAIRTRDRLSNGESRRAQTAARSDDRDGEGSRAWESLARSGEHADAYEAIADRFEDEAAAASAERLLLLADVARLSGHPREAVAPLEQLLGEHPGDPRAPIAAVVLGRIEMDMLGRRDRARAAFERALELGVPGALRADVDRRLADLRASAPAE